MMSASVIAMASRCVANGNLYPWPYIEEEKKDERTD